MNETIPNILTAALLICPFTVFNPDAYHLTAKTIEPVSHDIAYFVEDIGVNLNNSLASNMRSLRKNTIGMSPAQEYDYYLDKEQDDLSEQKASGDVSQEEIDSMAKTIENKRVYKPEDKRPLSDN